MIVEGGLITVPTPTPTVITTQIGVGTPFAPFSINATTPATLQIYVFGTTATTPAFMPVTDIDPTTVVVAAVPMASPSRTPRSTGPEHGQLQPPDRTASRTPSSRSVPARRSTWPPAR